MRRRSQLTAAALTLAACGAVGAAAAGGAAPRADVTLTPVSSRTDEAIRVRTTVGSGATGNLWVAVARTTAPCGPSAAEWQTAVGTGIRWLTGGPALPDAPAATAADAVSRSSTKRLLTTLGPTARDEGTWTACAWLAVQNADGAASTHDDLRLVVVEDRLGRGLLQTGTPGGAVLPRRPARFTLSPAARVTGARWRGWGTATASGTGVLVYGDSAPRIPVPVRLRALRPGTCRNRPVYTRVTYELVRPAAGVPARAPFDLTDAECSIP